MIAESHTTDTDGEGQRCPIDHSVYSGRKAEPPHQAEHADGSALVCVSPGVWQVRSYAAAREILRSADTKQAGFRAELLEQMPTTMNRPILYQEGQPHHTQRRQTARFFTPKFTSDNYRAMMEALSDEIVAELRQRRSADVSALSMRLAVRVAAQVVGLTNSLLPGMDRRLDAFFSGNTNAPTWNLRSLLTFARNQTRVLQFLYLDVKPAIRARRRSPQADVISHLLAQGYRDAEILTECITYGAAGMATTREFICVAVWHMLEQPALRTRYLAADEEERYAILHEILRLEPVVGHLHRRATSDMQLDIDGVGYEIAAGDLIDLNIYAINADADAVGEHPLNVCLGRERASESIPTAVMSFGDGAHRCPGAFIAIQESDIFLQRLLAIDGLQIERLPDVTWSEITAGYELRRFVVAVPGERKRLG